MVNVIVQDVYDFSVQELLGFLTILIAAHDKGDIKNVLCSGTIFSCRV